MEIQYFPHPQPPPIIQLKFQLSQLTVFNFVSSEFREINVNINIKHNLTLAKKKALKTLQNNKDLVIRNADKGGGVVLQNWEDYLMEAYRIRSDNNYYSTLTFNPSIQYQK